jgi:hypothetical protein
MRADYDDSPAVVRSLVVIDASLSRAIHRKNSRMEDRYQQALYMCVLAKQWMS